MLETQELHDTDAKVGQTDAPDAIPARLAKL